jgi:hypothetical protein
MELPIFFYRTTFSFDSFNKFFYFYRNFSIIESAAIFATDNENQRIISLPPFSHHYNCVLWFYLSCCACC